MNIEIANRLQKLRKEKGLSQEELAFKLGISRQAISKWECGESSPDTDNLISLSKLYGISIDEILFGESSIKDAKKEEDNIKDEPELDKEHIDYDLENEKVHDSKKDQHIDKDLKQNKINNKTTEIFCLIFEYVPIFLFALFNVLIWIFFAQPVTSFGIELGNVYSWIKYDDSIEFFNSSIFLITFGLLSLVVLISYSISIIKWIKMSKTNIEYQENAIYTIRNKKLSFNEIIMWVIQILYLVFLTISILFCVFVSNEGMDAGTCLILLIVFSSVFFVISVACLVGLIFLRRNIIKNTNDYLYNQHIYLLKKSLYLNNKNIDNEAQILAANKRILPTLLNIASTACLLSLYLPLFMFGSLISACLVDNHLALQIIHILNVSFWIIISVTFLYIIFVNTINIIKKDYTRKDYLTFYTKVKASFILHVISIAICILYYCIELFSNNDVVKSINFVAQFTLEGVLIVFIFIALKKTKKEKQSK